jgi:hypothetical protein
MEGQLEGKRDGRVGGNEDTEFGVEGVNTGEFKE